MKAILKQIYHLLPFRLKLWIEILIKNRVDEVEIVYHYLKSRKNGIMIDVGAHYGSSLRKFMIDNWEIHAFEPDPNNRAKLFDLIKDASNVRINNEAVNNKS